MSKENNKMTKRELLKQLEGLTDDAIIHFSATAYDDDNRRYSIFVKEVDIDTRKNYASIHIISEHPDNM